MTPVGVIEPEMVCENPPPMVFWLRFKVAAMVEEPYPKEVPVRPIVCVWPLKA